MFVAASLAAAAALTAISTTTAVGNTHPQSSQTLNHTPAKQNKPHLTWHQYAMQRRNSMQRRKFEIDKRIKQASAANNKSNTHSNELKQFQSNSLNTFDGKSKKNSVYQSLDTNEERPVLTYQYSLDQGSGSGAIPQLEILKAFAAKNGQTLESMSLNNDSWLNGLNTDVCNEFIRLHNIHTAETNSSNLINGQNLEMNDISQALLEYLQTNNINEESQIFTDLNPSNNFQLGNNNNQSLDYKKASKMASVQNSKRPNRRSKQKYDSLRYSWNPKWLRILRKTTCLPVAIITLFLLIFTNLSSNWVYIEENQRAGLWAVCKSKIDLSNPTTLKYLIDNEIDNNSNSLARKLKKPKPLFEKPKKIEECYSKFLLKDDTHLVVLALILVGFFFHLIGLVFMIIGIFFSTSNKTLYYYHSAGECLLSSALILGIDLFAFASLVSSQINQSYKFGYCFYTNLTISLVIFFYSLLFYLDDLVNEYHSWRKKITEENP